MTTNLDRLMSPKSIALIGVSDRTGSFNHQVLVNLRAFGYTGGLYLVNPSRTDVDGIHCYGSLADVDAEIDHAVVLVRPEVLEKVLDECEAKRVRSVTLVGQTLPLSDRPFRIVGPNTVGHANILEGIVPNAAGNFPLSVRPGNLGVVSQSGGVSTTIVARTVSLGLGVSHVIATGNEYDVDAIESVDWMLDQDTVLGIACYIEAIRDVDRLRSLGEKARELGKPIAVLKGGRSDVGVRAAAAHTAALATSGAITEAALRQWGFISVHTIDELLMSVAAGMRYPDVGGSRIGLFGIGGGIGVIATDMAIDAGLSLPDVPTTSKKKILDLLPDASPNNPFDPGGQLVGRGTEKLCRALSMWADETPVDAVVFSVQPLNEVRERQFVDAIAEAIPSITKPTFVAKFRGDDEMGIYTTARLREAGTLVFEPADVGLRSIRLWADWVTSERPTNVQIDKANDNEKRASFAAELEARSERAVDSLLLEHDATSLLQMIGLPTLESQVVKDAHLAVAAARRMGFPVAMKLLSPDVVHRAKAGAVRLNITDTESVRNNFAELAELANGKRYEGVLVQRMAASGLELIVGLHTDPVFGPVVLVGAGGVLSELFGDVAFLFPPYSAGAASKALYSLRISAQFLDWNVAPQDEGKLVDLLLTIGDLATDCGNLIGSLDLNPVVIHGGGKGVSVLDALLYLA